MFLLQAQGKRRWRIGAQQDLTLVEGLPLKIVTSARARRVSLRVCAGTRTLKLTVPKGVSRARALDFVEQHRGWIAAQAARCSASPPSAAWRRRPWSTWR